jgi:selenide,water dikinase
MFTAMETKTVRLTQYSHGAGCGCKISPRVLSEILQKVPRQAADPRLLVGYDTRDDAAVYAIDDTNAMISTTDFFMPIVDDPFDFGAIAAVNAISDVYAMGGKPLLAIAILGWPVNKLDATVAGDVLQGARDACSRAGIPLAGGHSIDAPEPIFGLAVTGMIERSRIRSNNLARSGDELYLTKPLGVGILTTAQKRGVLQAQDMQAVRKVMLELNDIGAELSTLDGVRSMTDVTGFGLLGHLIEMCDASGVSADVEFESVPRLGGLSGYIAQGCVPGGTTRNFESFGDKLGAMTDEQRLILCDPQTSGGLLVSVDPQQREAFLEVTRRRGLNAKAFGRLVTTTDSTRVRFH